MRETITIKTLNDAVQYLSDLKPMKFNQAKSAAKRYMHTGSIKFLDKQKFVANHGGGTSVNAIEAVMYVAAGTNDRNWLTVSFLVGHRNVTVVNKAVDSWFKNELNQQDLGNVPNIYEYINDYFDKYRNKQWATQAPQPRKREYNQQKKTKQQLKFIDKTTFQGRPKEKFEFTRKGMFWLLLFICFVVGVVYDNGIMQEKAQLLSLGGACVLAILFNDSEIGWRRYVLLVISIECLEDHPLLSILSVLFIIPSLSKKVIHVFQRATRN